MLVYFLKSDNSLERVQVLLLPPHPDYILKLFFYYFILYFNIRFLYGCNSLKIKNP